MRDAGAFESHLAALTGRPLDRPIIRPATRRGLSGFTLIELMITLLVGAILLTIAMPSFRAFVQNSRLSTEANTLVYSLNLARDDAVKMDTPIDVCASINGTSCGGSWANGWIVLCSANCPPSLGASPVVLQVEPAIATGTTASEQISGATDLSYSGNGQTGAAYQFVFCDNRGAASGRDVEVNLIGRMEASPTAGQQVSGVALAGC